MRESPEGAIANSLWRHYETGLPDTPYQMALLIAHQLRQEGYLKPSQEVVATLCPQCKKQIED